MNNVVIPLTFSICVSLAGTRNETWTVKLCIENPLLANSRRQPVNPCLPQRMAVRMLLVFVQSEQQSQQITASDMAALRLYVDSMYG